MNISMNTHYTIHNDTEVDRFVQDDLDQIVRALKQLMGANLVAVILTGGFGRGEGSVMIEASGKMHIVNDYDIDVIYKERWGRFPSKLIIHMFYRKRLEKLAEKLANTLNLKQVDLGLSGISSYEHNNTPRLADFDLKYGHRVIYGDINPAEVLPDYNPSDILAFEGTWLLRNRGVGLLLAYLYLKDDIVSDEKKEYFYVEVTKAILAMGDALFIIEGCYHNSYAVRDENLHKVLPGEFVYTDELERLYHLASGYKLRPQIAMYPDITPKQLWKDVNNLYCAFILYYESRRLGRDFTNLIEYAAWVNEQPKSGRQSVARQIFDQVHFLLKFNGSSFRMAYLKYDKPRSCAFAFCLLAARNDSKIDPAYMQILSSMAKFRQQTPNLVTGWINLVRTFLMLAHPKGELARALKSQ